MTCSLASFAFYILDREDRPAIRTLLLARAIESGSHLLGELTGLYKPVDPEQKKDSRLFTAQSAMALLSSAFLCYAFVNEVRQIPSGFLPNIIYATRMSQPEKQLFDSVRAMREIQQRVR